MLEFCKWHALSGNLKNCCGSIVILWGTWVTCLPATEWKMRSLGQISPLIIYPLPGLGLSFSFPYMSYHRIMGSSNWSVKDCKHTTLITTLPYPKSCQITGCWTSSLSITWGLVRNQIRGPHPDSLNQKFCELGTTNPMVILTSTGLQHEVLSRACHWGTLQHSTKPPVQPPGASLCTLCALVTQTTSFIFMPFCLCSNDSSAWNALPTLPCVCLSNFPPKSFGCCKCWQACFQWWRF